MNPMPPKMAARKKRKPNLRAAPSNHSRLLAVQRRIYLTLKREADELLGTMPPAIRAYERACQKDFVRACRGADDATRVAAVSKARLVAAMRAADVSFVADFHAFPQAQRTALRLLRDCARPGENWVLGLEMFSSRHQAELDAYAAGKLSTSELLEVTRYAEEWGFPWRNYAPLVHEAIARGVRLLALNRPKELSQSSALSGSQIRRVSEARELQDRDRWAAGLITDLISAGGRKASRPRLIALYGDLHVGRNHLPSQLERVSRDYLGKPLRSVSVHQNQDELYWALARSGREHSAQIVRLESDSYCVFSSTPWAKLQSLVSWAETAGLVVQSPAALAAAAESSGLGRLASRPAGDTHHFDDEFDAHETDEDSDTAYEGDPLYWIQSYGMAIAEFLKSPPPDYGALHVFTLDDADFVEHLDRALFDREELAMVRLRILANRCLYVRRSELAYLGSLSPNAAAELAAIHLFRSRTQAGGLRCATLEDASRSALESAFGFFGSLLVNPRRKCELPADLALRYEDLRAGLPGARGKPARPDYPAEEEGLGLALEAIRRGIDALAPRADDPRSETLAARQARAMGAYHYGRILGKRLYDSLMTGEVELALARDLLAPRTQGSHVPFERRVSELREQVGVAPRNASKSDSI